MDCTDACIYGMYIIQCTSIYDVHISMCICIDDCFYTCDNDNDMIVTCI